MMNPPRSKLERHQLPVRRRETIHPGHAVAQAGTVHCPRRDGTATVRECMICEACAGLDVDRTGHAQVVCDIDPAENASASPRRRSRRPTDGDRTPLSAVMSSHITCVNEELPAEELVTLLVGRGFSGVPVVDSTGKPVGVVSKSDLIEDTRGLLVRDLMMPIAFTLPENATLSQAAALMAYENIHRVPVVAADGAVIGIISALDIARWVAEQDGYAVGRTP
jgi:CBS domain-containing protein